MKRKIFLVTMLGLMLSVQTALADLKVGEGGKVGIGTEPGTDALTVVSSDSIAGSFSTSKPSSSAAAVKGQYTGSTCSDVRGVIGESIPCPNYGIGGNFKGGWYGVLSEASTSGSGLRYGVRGTGRYGTLSNYGLYGYGYGGATSYGVYGYGAGATTNYGIYGYGTTYAGYFSGNVHITGTLSAPSDEKIKENIQPLGNVTSKLMKIKAKSFNYRKDDPKYKPMNLAKGRKIGLIAQELEAVFPELVSDEVFVLPDETPDPMAEGDAVKEEREPEVINYKSINYLELIPILVQAIQEQQEEIDALKGQLATVGGSIQ